MKSHPKEKRAWPWAWGASQILRFHFNIYTMAEAIGTFNLVHSLLLPRPTTPRGKVGVALG